MAAVALITPGRVSEPLEGDAVEVRQVLGPLRLKPFKEGGTGAGDGSDIPTLVATNVGSSKEADPERNMICSSTRLTLRSANRIRMSTSRCALGTEDDGKPEFLAGKPGA
jgi:hypothetical protein